MDKKVLELFKKSAASNTFVVFTESLHSTHQAEAKIKQLKKSLPDSGRLILALDNPLALKYWSGYRDESTGRLFDSFAGSNTGLSKLELEALLKRCFKNVRFSYPYPDHRSVRMIFSEDYLPGKSCSFPLNILPSMPEKEGRYNIFSEALAMKKIEEAGLFEHFANSFIIEASDSRLSDFPDFCVFQSSRRQKFKITTKRVQDSGESFFSKIAEDTSVEHLQSMINTYKEMSEIKDVFVAEPISKSESEIWFRHIVGKNAEHELLEAILNEDESMAKSIVARFLSLIESLPSVNCNPSSNDKFCDVFGDVYNSTVECAKIGVIDLNLDNIIIDDKGRWNLIDYEWFFEFPVPKEYLIGRFVYFFFFRRYKNLFASYDKKINFSKGTVPIPEYLCDLLEKYTTNESLDKIVYTEAHFQRYVEGKTIEPEDLLASNNDNMDLDKLVDELHETRDINVQLVNTVKAKDIELQSIKSSKAYKLARSLANAKNKTIRRR